MLQLTSEDQKLLLACVTLAVSFMRHNEECAIKVSMGARDPVSYPGYVVYSIYGYTMDDGCCIPSPASTFTAKTAPSTSLLPLLVLWDENIAILQRWRKLFLIGQANFS